MSYPCYLERQDSGTYNSYKYQCVVFDIELCWHEHVDSIVKTINYRMFCFRKLNSFHVNRKMLSTSRGRLLTQHVGICLLAS